MRKISDLIHTFSEEWIPFLESSRKINNNKSFFVIDSQKSTYKFFVFSNDISISFFCSNGLNCVKTNSF